MAAAKEKEKRKRSLLTIKTGASSGHITKLKQSVFLRCLWCAIMLSVVMLSVVAPLALEENNVKTTKFKI